MRSKAFSMKEGRLSRVGERLFRARPRDPGHGAVLSMAPSNGETRLDRSIRRRISESGLSGSHKPRGACRSERLTTSQHVPDSLTQGARQLDGGDLAAALAAKALLGGVVALSIERVPGSHMGSFNQRPAQMPGAVFGQRTADVAFAGLSTLGHRPL